MPKITSSRKERLAINLFDIGRLGPALRNRFLAGKLNLQEPIWVDRNNPHETAVAFLQERTGLMLAAVICDLIRSEDRKANRPPSRVYLNRGNGWLRIPGNAVLTQDEGGGLTLNSDVFPVADPFLPPELSPVMPERKSHAEDHSE